MKEHLRRIEEATPGTPEFIESLLTAILWVLRRLWTGVKIVIVAAGMLAVIMLALQFQVSSRNDDIKRNAITSQEAKQAATDAKNALEAAIHNPATAAQVKASQDAINAIGRIENYLCGGPCPDDDPTTTPGGN